MFICLKNVKLIFYSYIQIAIFVIIISCIKNITCFLVCVTILSSDEEDSKAESNKTTDSNQDAINKSLSEKEPIITESTQGADCSSMSGKYV